MPQSVISTAKEHMDKSVGVFVDELAKTRTGRASTSLLESVMVQYYGNPTPLNQVASLSVPEPRLITVKPFEAKLIPDIERAIMLADLGLMPANDGKTIRVPIPQLTEERRKDMVRQLKKVAEEARVSVRNIRRDTNDQLKKMQKAGDIPEDDLHKYEKQVQELTDTTITHIDKILEDKESDMMKV